jgi:hypothetical protein
VDAVLSWIIGFDPARIRLIEGAASSREPFWLGHSAFDRMSVESNTDWRLLNLHFAEPLGWEDYLRRGSHLTAGMTQRLNDIGRPDVP